MSTQKKKTKMEASASSPSRDTKQVRKIVTEEDDDQPVVVNKASEIKIDVVSAKAEAIIKSAMPEDQKMRYLMEIGAIKKVSDDGKIPFNVYAKIRKVAKDRLRAMEVYPKAKNVRLAMLAEWDDIFKDF